MDLKKNSEKTDPITAAGDNKQQEERPRVAYAPGVADRMENEVSAQPAFAAPPDPPEPYPAPGFPKVLFSLYDALPPKVVFNKEEQAKFDKRKWTAFAFTPEKDEDAEKEKWPKVFFREPPKIINNPKEAAELSGEWKEFQMPKQAEAAGPTSEPAKSAPTQTTTKHDR